MHKSRPIHSYHVQADKLRFDGLFNEMSYTLIIYPSPRSCSWRADRHGCSETDRNGARRPRPPGSRAGGPEVRAHVHLVTQQGPAHLKGCIIFNQN